MSKAQGERRWRLAWLRLRPVAQHAGVIVHHAGIIVFLLGISLALLIAWVAAESKIRDLQRELGRLQARVLLLEAQKATIWEVLNLERALRPTVRLLPARPGGRPNLVRVELSPRVENGLVCEVTVCWGDTGSERELIYQAVGGIKSFEAVHEYVLPPAGQTTSWTLQVFTVVPEAWVKHQLLSSNQLTSTCRIEATADGVRVAGVNDTAGPKVQPPPLMPSEIEWLTPISGAEVGWKTKVILRAQTDTERVTLLVRPHPGATFYVQGGARPLSAGKEESFEVQLGGRRISEIGTKFDVLAVCSDTFMPSQWFLDLREIPHSLVIGRATVQKAAGAIRLEADGDRDGLIHALGEIHTPDGGALLVRQGPDFTVLKTLRPSPVGSRFDERLQIPASGDGAVYLLVYKETIASTPSVGETIPETLTALHWLYKPAQIQEETSARP